MTRTDAAGQTTTYTYDPTTYQLLTVTDPKNETTTYTYNSNGQLASVTGPVTGTTTTLEYDGYGRLWRVTDPDGYAVTTEYDALDRATVVTYPDGTYEETDYDKLDPVKYRDRLGRWTQTFYDALRRPVATRDPAGRITQRNEWVSCSSGCGGGTKISKLVDANGNATTWQYDLEGRVTQQIRANGATYNFAYENTTSRLASVQDPLGQVTTIQHNRDNTWSGVTYTNTQKPTPNVSFTYDPVYRRLTSLTDGTGTTNYTYNPITSPPALGAGRLASVDGPLGNDTIAYGYDELGRATSHSINGVSATATYDNLGRLSSQTNALGTFGYTYDGVTDRLTGVSYPNGQTIAFAYFGNQQDRALQEIDHKLSGGAFLSRFQYTYAANGALATWTQQVGTNPATSYQLDRDAVDHLTAATLQTTDPTPVVLKRYRYAIDPADNRTAEQVDDAVMGATYNNMNQLVSQQTGGTLIFKGTVSEPATVTVGGKPATVTADNHFTGSVVVPGGTGTVVVTATDYASPARNTRTNTYQVSESGAGKSLTFDANGNLTSDGVRTFEWDGVNRLVAVSSGTHRSEFTYDGWGHRVRIVEKDNGATTSDRRFLWCGLSIYEERDSGGANVVRRFFDLGMQEGGVSYYYTRDHLGSIRELTDASGALRARYDYDPYGRQTKLSGDKDSVFGFTGHFSHAPSGLALAPFRAYDPTLGRWLSEDPIGLAGGINRYGYVGGRPLDAGDPLGLVADAPAMTQPTVWQQITAAAAAAGEAIVTAAAGVGAGALAVGAAAVAVVGLALIQDGGDHFPPPPVPPANPPATTTANPPGGEVIPFPPVPPAGFTTCIRFAQTNTLCMYRCGKYGTRTMPNSCEVPCPPFFFIGEITL